MMRNIALQERRNRQILADIVRTYIETGEPVSSRAISKRFEETLSTATIRTVMADLEDGGLLYQPHTSAGRVPTAAAYRFFAQEIASRATLSVEDRDWIKREFDAASSSADMTERAGHVLADVSNGLGIIVSPPLSKTVLEHARMWLLPDGRVVVVLITHGGVTRDKILRPHRLFTQLELDATAEFLNSHYSGWTLEAIRGDLLQKLATERERYEGLVQSALTLCDPAGTGPAAAGNLCTACAAGASMATCTPPGSFLAGKGYPVQNVGGTVLMTPPSGAAYVLISHGESGGGAYMSAGVVAPTTSRRRPCRAR